MKNYGDILERESRKRRHTRIGVYYKSNYHRAASIAVVTDLIMGGGGGCWLAG